MIRVQRKRTKGFKLPPNTKCVNRGTKWGNPIRLIGDMIYINARHRRKILDPWVYYNVGNIDYVIYLYRKLWDGTKFQNQDFQYWADRFDELDIKELKGKNLACFCSLSTPCHADVLLQLAKK